MRALALASAMALTLGWLAHGWWGPGPKAQAYLQEPVIRVADHPFTRAQVLDYLIGREVARLNQGRVQPPPPPPSAGR